MKNLIKKIAPPGYEKSNRRKLYDIVSKLGVLTSDDSIKVLRNFFPYLADKKALAAHGKALSIPRYSNDTDESYRLRVATALLYVKERGTRGFFKNAFAQRFEGRNTDIIEEFLHLTVKVLDMSEKDRAWLYEFLEAELDPNILIALVDWFQWVERIESEESLNIDLASSYIDAWYWGVTYSGEILYDHGEELYFDGVLAYDGSQDLSAIRAKEGTWTGENAQDIYFSGLIPMNGTYTHQGEFCFSVDKGSGVATYGQNGNDELVISLGSVLFDKSVLLASYASAIPMDGSFLYGENDECFASDELVLNIGGI